MRANYWFLLDCARSHLLILTLVCYLLLGTVNNSVSLLLLSDTSQNGDCVYKHDGVWWGRGCHYNHSFMCYDEKLVLVKENKTWEEALNHCRFLGAVDTNDPNSPYRNHRYDLATLITTDDHTYARERAQQATTDEVGQFPTAYSCCWETHTPCLQLSLCSMLSGVDGPV